MSVNFTEINKYAKAILTAVFLAATGFLAYGDIIPLPASVRGPLVVACGFVGTIAVFFKKNATQFEADAKKAQEVLALDGINVDLVKIVDQGLSDLGVVVPDNKVVPAPVAEPVVPVDPNADIA